MLSSYGVVPRNLEWTKFGVVMPSEMVFKFRAKLDPTVPDSQDPVIFKQLPEIL